MTEFSLREIVSELDRFIVGQEDANLALAGFILLVSASWGPLRRALRKRLPARLSGRPRHPLVSSAA